jgi:hypothetical protein
MIPIPQRHFFESVLVSRRLFGAEVSSKEGVEPEGMKILAGVRTNFSEN